MAKKHKLTKKTDHIDGSSGKDLFLAPMFEAKGEERATFSNKDVLNGRGGIDTIKAFIAADALKPTLKNIEKAVLTRHDIDALSLDLARAGKLSSIKLNNFDSDVDISHAGRLSNFTLKNVTNQHEFSIDGIDAAKVGTMNFNFVKAGASGSETSVKINSNAALSMMDFKLADSVVSMSLDQGAEKLSIHSAPGSEQNRLSLHQDPAKNITKSVTIDGAGDLAFRQYVADGNGSAPTNLESLDASKMTGSLNAGLGGPALKLVLSGSGDDQITLDELAMSATIDLGAGDDQLHLEYLDLSSTVPDAKGGQGYDTVTISGNLANPASILKEFEHLVVYNPIGAYDLKDSGISTVTLFTPLGVTLDNLANDSTLNLYLGTKDVVNANVVDAAVSLEDTLTLNLGAGSVGGTANGFNSIGLSNLNISVDTGAYAFYLGKIGAVTDPTKITISGDYAVKMETTITTRYVSEVTITNSAGVDLYGMRDQDLALLGKSISFVSTGATINGGDGNDVLVGGAGNDTISSGAGDNVIHGSLGADIVNLMAGSGADVLVYDNVKFSDANGIDLINNFGAGDKIDISALISGIDMLTTVTDFGVGIMTYQNGKTNAFFDQAQNRLYVDIDKSGTDSSGDLVIELAGVDSMTSADFLF